MKYPLYVISKGRFENCLTANFLIKDQVPFTLVVEPQEYDQYRAIYPDIIIATLPFSNLGLGSYPARNWVWEDSIQKGFKKHWILDDNIRGVRKLFKGIRINCNSIHAFNFVEDLAENYTNIGIAGMNYEMFVTGKTNKPIVTNHHVYSNLLIENKIPYRWRLKYNEDTDLCLQVLKGNLCTLYTNIFMISKMRTMTMKGGNTKELYKGDGRLKMARMLENTHPDLVTTVWKFGRPQHSVKWEVFKQKLNKSKDYKVLDLNDYGKLRATEQLSHPKLKKLIKKVIPNLL